MDNLYIEWYKLLCNILYVYNNVNNKFILFLIIKNNLLWKIYKIKNMKIIFLNKIIKKFLC